MEKTTAKEHEAEKPFKKTSQDQEARRDKIKDRNAAEYQCHV